MLCSLHTHSTQKMVSLIVQSIAELLQITKLNNCCIFDKNSNEMLISMFVVVLVDRYITLLSIPPPNPPFSLRPLSLFLFIYVVFNQSASFFFLAHSYSVSFVLCRCECDCVAQFFVCFFFFV